MPPPGRPCEPPHRLCVERGSGNQAWPPSKEGTPLSFPTTGTPPRISLSWGTWLLLRSKRMKIDTDWRPVLQQLHHQASVTVHRGQPSQGPWPGARLLIPYTDFTRGRDTQVLQPPAGSCQTCHGESEALLGLGQVIFPSHSLAKSSAGARGDRNHKTQAVGGPDAPSHFCGPHVT